MNAIILTEEQYLKIFNHLEMIEKQLLERKDRESEDRYLTNRRTAKMLEVSTRTLQNWRDQGLISFVQIGNKIYYRAEDIDCLMQNHLNISFGNK